MAANVTELAVPQELVAAYRRCRHLTRSYGTTYYWATQLLPRPRRPHVYALYGFCRLADEIVDDIVAEDGAVVATGDGAVSDVDQRAAALTAVAEGLAAAQRGEPVDEPVFAAVAHTIATFAIDPGAFDRFLHSMRMDLTVERYQTWADLCGYMDGSAAVIGEMMLPILDPISPAAVAPARDLGLAFQLTNFLRDVGEDLDRGRVYLPQDDLARFGADPHRRTVDDGWRAVARFEIDRARDLYRSADAGIALLPRRAGRAIGAARILYSEILDAIEANGYDVFTQRARVPLTRKLAVVSRRLIR